MKGFGSMPKHLANRIGASKIRELSGLSPEVLPKSKRAQAWREKKKAGSA
jgi:hypothetical protein